MKLAVAVGLIVSFLMQPGPRAPLAPAETLLEPAALRAIAAQPTTGDVATIAGPDPSMGDVALTCVAERCNGARDAMRKIRGAIASKAIDAPVRSIRLVSSVDATQARRLKAAIHVAEVADRPFQVIRGAWSTAGIGDEVVEVFARHAAATADAPAATVTVPSAWGGMWLVDKFGGQPTKAGDRTTWDVEVEVATKDGPRTVWVRLTFDAELPELPWHP